MALTRATAAEEGARQREWEAELEHFETMRVSRRIERAVDHF